MASERQLLSWTQNRGQNGWDSPLDIPTTQCLAARNVHLYNGGLGTRRGGSTSVTITGVTAPINAMAEFLPGQDETAAELFVVDNSTTKKILRCAGGTSFSNLTLADDIASLPWEVSNATLNGKLYLAYDSTVNRLHVFDPAYSTTTLRRAGVGTPAAPTAADGGGAGSYAATLRYYRVAFLEVRSGVTIRRSLLSPALSFTPDGSHASVTVTKPASLSEGETHWELYGSEDDLLYYAIAANDVDTSVAAAIAVGTTTYTDATSPANYADNAAAPEEGQNTPFPSVKSIGTDGSRLYGLGVWESSAGDSLAPRAGRFYFGPVLDASDVNDDERINNTTTLSGWIDLARNAGAVDRGVSPKPVNNIIYAFQSAGVYGLVPTGSPTVPYRRIVLSTTVGNLAAHAITLGLDRNGGTCCYFLDPTKGPYVVGGTDGLRWCGKDVADLWATLNPNASITGWSVWDPDKMQVLFAITTGGGSVPVIMLVLDVSAQQLDQDGDLRGGWTVYDGDFARSRCAVRFSNTLASTRSAVKVLYVGAESKLLRYSDAAFADDSTAFQAYVVSGPVYQGIQPVRVDRAYVVADAGSGTSISHLLARNNVLLAVQGGTPVAADVQRSVITLTPSSTEQIVTKKVEDAAMQNAWMLQVQLGEIAADNTTKTWQLHQWYGQVTSEGLL